MFPEPRQDDEPPFLKPPFYLKPAIVFTASLGGSGEMSVLIVIKSCFCFGF